MRPAKSRMIRRLLAYYHKNCQDIHAFLVYRHTGYDVTSYFRSAFIEVRKTADNPTFDGFGWNFNGATLCLAKPVGGLLV